MIALPGFHVCLQHVGENIWCVLANFLILAFFNQTHMQQFFDFSPTISNCPGNMMCSRRVSVPFFRFVMEVDEGGEDSCVISFDLVLSRRMCQRRPCYLVGCEHDDAWLIDAEFAPTCPRRSIVNAVGKKQKSKSKNGKTAET